MSYRAIIPYLVVLSTTLSSTYASSPLLVPTTTPIPITILHDRDVEAGIIIAFVLVGVFFGLGLLGGWLWGVDPAGSSVGGAYMKGVMPAGSVSSVGNAYHTLRSDDPASIWVAG
jgi:hypothetical protein